MNLNLPLEHASATTARGAQYLNERDAGALLTTAQADLEIHSQKSL